MSTQWDPSRYLQFADARFRPAIELLQRIPLQAPATIVDLGCGTGDVTQLIANHWPDASVIGIDSSREMLAHARQHTSRVTWLDSSIETWVPDRRIDLIFSNAALHWVADHGFHLRRLITYLIDGGYLAVQMPLSWALPSHELMRETLATGGPDGTAIGPVSLHETLGRKPVQDARWYYDSLEDVVTSLDIWETEYVHVLEGEDAVLAWVRGSTLPPILHCLTETECTAFLTSYRGALADEYPRRNNGRTLYPFRRLFIVARK